MATNTARTAASSGLKKMSNDPWQYHLKDKSAFWEKFRRAVVVNPDSNNGLIDVRSHRHPNPGNREEKYAKASSKASDIAGNPYWQRDQRRHYPKTHTVTQEYLAGLLLAAPDRAAAIGWEHGFDNWLKAEANVGNSLSRRRSVFTTWLYKEQTAAGCTVSKEVQVQSRRARRFAKGHLLAPGQLLLAVNMHLLALNCGSSSFKFKLFDVPSLTVAASGQASAIGSDTASLSVNDANQDLDSGASHHDIFRDVLSALRKTVDNLEIDLVTHRIVHGATEKDPMVVTKDHQEGLELMDKLSSFAPLHNHHAVLVVRASLKILPDAKNVLCFDTLFHQTLPDHVKTYPIGKGDVKAPIPLQKYGFHGLSYSSILKNAAKYLGKDVNDTDLIICHLGSGASMCCIKQGKSIDTTMGLTPLEGLPGGTRSGSLDPTLVFHMFGDDAAQIVNTKGISVAKSELALNKEAGLLGLTGSTDFKVIMDRAEQGSPKEVLAVAVFVDRILHYLGAYLLLLKNKPAAIVFSGGIGEKAAALRQSVAAHLDYLGVRLDSGKNDQSSKDIVHEISAADSKIKLLRVLTDEELECAELAMQFV